MMKNEQYPEKDTGTRNSCFVHYGDYLDFVNLLQSKNAVPVQQYTRTLFNNE